MVKSSICKKKRSKSIGGKSMRYFIAFQRNNASFETLGFLRNRRSICCGGFDALISCFRRMPGAYRWCSKCAQLAQYAYTKPYRFCQSSQRINKIKRMGAFSKDRAKSEDAGKFICVFMHRVLHVEISTKEWISTYRKKRKFPSPQSAEPPI